VKGAQFHSSFLSLLLAALWPFSALAELQVLPDKEPQCVFTGEGRKIRVLLHNAGGDPVEAVLRTRMYQASSATAAPLGETPWKKLTVLPGQTVFESAAVTFPPVKEETRFLVQWLDDANKVIGITEVLVYPPDLLRDLKPLGGEEPLGVLDPQNQLKPLLKAVGLEYQDLDETGLDHYDGRLAIIGPFQSRGQMGERLPGGVKSLARKGVAVVWIQPPPEKRHELEPSFYTVPEGKGAVVVVQADLAANLAQSPKAQLHLIQLARLALHPEPPRLPHQTPSP
jgi:hypothetical protein